MQQLLRYGLIRNTGDELHYSLLHSSTCPVELLNKTNVYNTNAYKKHTYANGSQSAFESHLYIQA